MEEKAPGPQSSSRCQAGERSQQTSSLKFQNHLNSENTGISAKVGSKQD